MHLTAKQIALLLIPFVVTAVVYVFSFDIAKNIRYLFPVYEEYKNKTLDKKAAIYLKIESNGKLYQQIKEKIRNRRKNAKWVVTTVLYKKLPQKSMKIYTQNGTSKKNITSWKLEAVFSKLKVAIINGTVVKENGFVNGARVVKILDEKVLLSFKKGKKWVYLFH